LVPPSVTSTSIEFVPKGKIAVKETLVVSGPVGVELVCTDVPFTDQKTLRATVSGLDKSTVTVVGELHGTVPGCGHVTVGAASTTPIARAERSIIQAGFIIFAVAR
jgi:hypothetical protein